MGAPKKAKPKPLFKSHNTLGLPLCPCCGHNPRTVNRAKCGRCEREGRPIQWDRLGADVQKHLRKRFNVADQVTHNLLTHPCA